MAMCDTNVQKLNQKCAVNRPLKMMFELVSWQVLPGACLAVGLGFLLGYYLCRKTRQSLQADNKELAAELDSVKVSGQQCEAALDAVELLHRSKNQFYYSTSHDLKQPLHALEMFTAVLQKQELNDCSKDIVRDLSEVAKDITREIDVLLDIARVDVEVLKLCPVEIDLGAETRRIANQFLRPAKEKSLQLQVTVSDDQIVHLDRALFDRILRNLIDNAIKFTDVGFVKIVADYNQDSSVILSVTDSGIGIGKEDLEGLYREFYQGKMLADSYLSGMGLGLNSVLKMIKRLNGKIDIDSSPGCGTTVTVRIPNILAGVKLPQDSLNKKPDQAIDPNLKTVLIFQTDNLVGKSTAMLIGTAGFNVLITNSLSEAYELQKTNPLDAACLEFSDASDLARRFLATLRLRNPVMPIVVMASDLKFTELCAGLSVTVLQKPVNAELLLEKIHPQN